MQSWQDFLATQTLNPVLDTDCALCDLSHLGLIHVTGEDKSDFIQGQLTNDITQVNDDISQLSSYCDPKGRMLASFRIFQHQEALFMLMPREQVEPILRRLKMFVLRAKVTLEDVTEQLAIIELAGDCAASCVSHPPDAVNAVTHQAALTVIRAPGDRSRLQILGDVESVQAIWRQAAQQGAVPISSQGWRLLDIRAGLPQIYSATTGAFVPQMANMQLVDGINFKKGCYTGQEVVARMQYLGKLKRRMYRLHINADPMPKIGEDLYPKTAESTQSTGKIVDIAPTAKGGYEALAIGRIDDMEADNIRLGTAEQATIQRLSLPYVYA